jgi:thioredoxin-disulfide reductase
MLDLLIIGAGPAGLSAAIYAARRKLNFRIISKDIGGQTAKSSQVENYLGIWGSGAELTAKFAEQLANLGVKIEAAKIVTMVSKKENEMFETKLEDGEVIESKAVILAAGKEPRHLNVPGEEELYGKGVTYCATCDAPLFRNKVVVVIGGGNSALDSAINLSNYASKIFVLSDEPKFRGEQVRIDKVLTDPKIEAIFNTRTIKILGTDFVEGLEYEDKISGETKSIEVQGVFVEIGWVTKADFIEKELVELDKWGQVIVDNCGRTKTPGLFAAGDFTNVEYKQAIVAAGEGAKAALAAIDFISRE